MVTLIPKRLFTYPIEGKNISPNVFEKKSVKEIEALEMWEGNRRLTIGDLFDVKNDEITSENLMINIVGNVKSVRNIGYGMSIGRIVVDGDVGFHVGEAMSGGTICVNGNAGSWAGSRMSGGTIEIKGNAGDYIGAAYRGSTEGMSGGTIVIHGNAGHEVGCFMRNGIIKILGNVGIFVGIHMRNGTIFVKGSSQGRAGAQMINGKIVLGGPSDDVMPTFTIEEVKKTVKVDGEKIEDVFYKFTGDLADKGKGKLFISRTHNEYLNCYDKYL